MEPYIKCEKETVIWLKNLEMHFMTNQECAHLWKGKYDLEVDTQCHEKVLSKSVKNLDIWMNSFKKSCEFGSLWKEKLI